MLLSLAISNYRSFAEEAVLDMQRRSFTTQRPRKDETWKQHTTRRAAIFGANASGKSNLLRPLGLLGEAVKHSLTNSEVLEALHDPHLLHKDEATSFEIEYVANDVRYRWSLVLDALGIASESLDANDSVRFRKVFERKRNEISFGPAADIKQAAKQNIEQFMRPWALVFSAWSTVKSPGKHGEAVQWWSRVLPLITGENDQYQRHQWLIKLAQRDPHWLSALKAVVRVADVGVRDIGIREEEVPKSVHNIHVVIQEDGTAELTQDLESEDIQEYLRYLLFEHSAGTHSFSLSEEEESKGTKTWMDLAIPALFALAVGGVLAVDEIDGSLHPLLVRQLVDFFDDPDLNTAGAQLLFSSHDISLIGRHPVEALERNEVWFVEKRDSRSELIALDEFPIRTAHNVEKRYLQGRYGAVPIAGNGELEKVLGQLRNKYLASLAGSE